MRLDNIVKHFGGVKSVDGVSVEFEAGKITSLIGPNGSGKSTLVDVVTGVTVPTKGAIFLSDDHALKRIVPSRNNKHGISRTFQDARLFEQMSVLDTILVVLTKRGVIATLLERSVVQYEATARVLLEKVGLWQKRNVMASELSYGQRKLLSIARAIAFDASIYFFDEPMSGLSEARIAVVRDILLELRSAGKAVVLIDHNMSLVRMLSDTTIVLANGKVLAAGHPVEVMNLPAVIDVYVGT